MRFKNKAELKRYQNKQKAKSYLRDTVPKKKILKAPSEKSVSVTTIQSNQTEELEKLKAKTKLDEETLAQIKHKISEFDKEITKRHKKYFK